MCGIVGIWNRDKSLVPSGLLIQMRDLLRLRGPDDAGIWLNGSIGFAHRRLSVIDISSLGHQPMVDEETGAVIVYNGEVYNYQRIKSDLEKDGMRFKSKTDTEVVLKAYRKWGLSCVEKFDGMFAFAIWDPKSRGIYLARDRMGIKPLYYTVSEKVFMFASRLSVLGLHPSCPNSIDEEALGLYLDMGFIPAPRSIIQGVKKLRPGHILWIDEKGMKETCYWSIDKIRIDNSLSRLAEKELIDRLDDMLRKSVKSRMISDVPLGVFLSGGIDSSLITSIIAQYSNRPIKAFTVGFEERPYDESDYARKIAQHLNVDHNLQVMKSDDLLSILDDNTANFDEPFADSSSLPTTMLSRFAKEDVTVCLSGDGADELFCGYHHYLILLYLPHFYHIPYCVRSVLGRFIEKISRGNPELLGQCLAQRDIPSCFAFMRSMNKYCSRQSFFKKDLPTMQDLFEKRNIQFPELDWVSRGGRLDAAYYLTDDILYKVDVASMSTSLEVRVPMLDHKIVEFAQSLPIKHKIKGMNNKWLLKKVLAKYIPEKIFARPKRGFVAPINKWFRAELKDMIQDELSHSRIKQFGYLEPSVVQKLLDLHLSNKCDTHPILWALLSLLRWKRRFRSHGV